MFLNISLVILGCFVVRSLSKLVIRNYALTELSNEKLREKAGFHLAVVGYIASSVVFYITVTAVLAYLVKTYLL